MQRKINGVTPMNRLTIALLSLLALPATALAQDAGDAAKGEKVFAKCMACHTIESGAAKRSAPNTAPKRRTDSSSNGTR